ncbi:hypothetical protein AQZ52_08070 [Novosphingobium fuchskuhlense]|uniref:Uncharacterized protein n=1 Tax=Novosphingobium fuchskuhlense TaxID=1117702 RepID=A0A124JUT3_9SPHN|nr:hypothetical protein [Novosphingobium fuchskuhlense]KUR71572.1 hypothetical protein AQZ52_08070 [Novosphingobium fuchskuhlense]
MTRLAVVLALVLAALPAAAKACVWLPVGNPSVAEQRHWSRVQTKQLQREAAKRLSSGQVAVDDELAELLVPNVRPIRLWFSDCGPEGELDLAGGIQGYNDNLFDDPRLKGIKRENHARVLREYQGQTILGPACNAEFRRRFAEWLQAELSAADREKAWLFLIARKREADHTGLNVYRRLVAFEYGTRRPPIRWVSENRWIARDLERFKRKKAAGRRLVAAMAAFWARQEPLLASDEAVCPSALATYRSDRENVISTILRERDEQVERWRQSRRAAPTP